LYRRFSRGEFDGVVLLMPTGWKPDVPCQRHVVRRERLILAAPRPPGAAATVRIAASDLAQRTWLLNPDGCGFRDALARTIAEAGGQLRVTFELDAAPYEHLAMVAAGVGCSILPASALTLHPALAEMKLPNPEILTFSPWPIASHIFARIASTSARLSAREKPILRLIVSARSARVSVPTDRIMVARRSLVAVHRPLAFNGLKGEPWQAAHQDFPPVRGPGTLRHDPR
jgi:hypothetical protein